MIIDRELSNASSGECFETTNPANAAVLATVPLGTSEDVGRAVAAARPALKSGIWARLEPRARMDVLYRFAALIEDHVLELGLLEPLDLGQADHGYADQRRAERCPHLPLWFRLTSGPMIVAGSQG